MDIQDCSKLIANVNFLRYCSGIFIVGQRVMCKVFMVLFQHHQPNPNVAIIEILQQFSKRKARLGPIETTVLERRESPTKMDITLLYRLLQLVCGLADISSSIWDKPGTPEEAESIEHTVCKIKNMRNKLCHDPGALIHMSEDELNDRLDELCKLCCHAVDKAGELSERDSRWIKNERDRIKMDIQDIRTKRPALAFSIRLLLYWPKQNRKQDMKLLTYCLTKIHMLCH